MANSTVCTDEVVTDWHGPAWDLAGLERERHRRVLAVLQVRARCEQVDAEPQMDNALLTQQQLSQAVRDLEDVDERLHELRSTQMRLPRLAY